MTSTVVPADDDLVERLAWEVEGSIYEGYEAAIYSPSEDRTVAHVVKYADAVTIASLSSELARCRNALEKIERCREYEYGSIGPRSTIARAALNPIGEEGAREP